MTFRPELREKCWWSVCSLSVGYVALYLFLPRGHVLTTIGDLAQCALLVLLVAAVAPNTQNPDPRIRLFWWLMSVSCGLWLTAQILWTYMEVWLRHEVPNPFFGDGILVLHLVFLMGALALSPHRERDNQVMQLGGLDFALLLTWWLYLYLFVVIPWQFVSRNNSAYGFSFDVVFFLEHCVFVIGAAAVWLRSSGGWRIVYRTLFFAAVVYAIASIATCLAIDYGVYYTGSVYDLPLILATAWFARLGLVAQKQTLRPETAPVERPTSYLWVSGLAVITILSLPAMAGWALYYSTAPAAVRSFRVLLTLVTMMILGTMTWIRQHRLDKQLARANLELREDSLTDVLTGTRNRRFLNATLDSDIRQAIRSYSLPLSAARRNRDLVFYIIDTDRFKEVNDRYGHDVGDKLLVEMARRLSSAIRHSDALIRWGGDEFLVASRYTDRNEAVALANRVLNLVGRDAFHIANVSIPCSCSIGWAPFPWFEQTPESVSAAEVIRMADAALYRAKNAGRNQAVGLLPASAAADSEGTVAEHKSGEQMPTRAVITAGPQPSESVAKPATSVKAMAAARGI